MCRQVTCPDCKKITWAGCGKHVLEAMKDVPVDQRCQCPRDPDEKNPSHDANFQVASD